MRPSEPSTVVDERWSARRGGTPAPSERLRARCGYRWATSGEQELGVTRSKQYNISEWYAEVAQKTGLVSYDLEGVSGLIVARPRGYVPWEPIQDYLDGEFKKTGVQNAYFLLFIPESYLEREKDIAEGFDPEVARVTHGGHEEPEERLAVCPTSESIIAPYMTQWVRSYRDFPFRTNQRASVVCWEATETKSFFRTEKFPWQEGHTAHETHDGAWNEMMTRLSQYRSLYEDVLVISMLRDVKPEHDKFSGADATTTVEAFMPDGKSVQAGTPHCLGTSFAEVFDFAYTTEDGDEELAHTTSRGLSWRSLDVLIMTYSNDQGLVLPPTIVSEQVAIVLIWQADTREKVLDYAKDIAEDLEDAGACVELDVRDERNPGFKFNEWELKGAPVRFEISPNEVGGGVATAVHRPDGDSVELDRESVAEAVQARFDEVYAKFYAVAEENLEENICEAPERNGTLGTISQYGGYVKVPWCGDEACEDEIKERIAAEIVMVPLNDEDAEIHDGENCAVCGDDVGETAYFAKSY